MKASINSETGTVPDEVEGKVKPVKWWDVRRTIAELHGLEAARAYDAYLKCHAARLKEACAIAGYGGTRE